MSNRQTKLKLWARDPRCFYCKKPTVISNIARGKLPQNECTLEHLYSRFYPERWVRRKKNQKRRVIACFKCNHERSCLEQMALSRAEVVKRSQGYSLSPKGKPKIIKTLENKKEVLAALGLTEEKK